MFFKILTIIALVKICSGGTPTYPLEHKSNQASYSQSFVREDIPLSYQYSAVHVYTPKENLNSKQKIPEKKLESQVVPYLPSNNKPGLNPLSYPVQYAPIPYKREDYKQQNEAGLYTQVTSPKYYENEVLERTKEYVRKPQLEPELELSIPARRPPPQAFNQFVPGHNIEVLPTPNRSPVSNNYHKIIDPQTLQQHPNLDHYLRQFTIRHETEQPATLRSFTPKILEYFTVTTENPTKPSFAYVPAEYYNNFQRSFQPKQNDVQRLIQPQVLQPMPSRAKDTKLQLNVARGLKVAQMAHQGHLNHGHFHSYPLHTEAIYKPIPSISDSKSYQNVTRLFPMGNQLQMSLYSES